MHRFAVFIATGFGVGNLPCSPGTYGTIVGAAIYFIEYFVFGINCIYANAVILVLMLVPAIFLSGITEKHFHHKDAQQIVVDEMLGYWLAVFMQPFSFKLMLAAFVLFRIFDIIKPFPIGLMQNLRGGVGVVADDVVAGLFSNAILTFLVVGVNIL